jgi:hypothetical protein
MNLFIALLAAIACSVKVVMVLFSPLTFGLISPVGFVGGHTSQSYGFAAMGLDKKRPI